MRKKFFLVIFLSSTISVIAQQPCEQYKSILQTAKKAAIKKDYKTAILKYIEAKLCSPQDNASLDQKISRLINSFEKQRDQAEKQAEQLELKLENSQLALERAKGGIKRLKQDVENSQLTIKNEMQKASFLLKNKLIVEQNAQVNSNALLALQLYKESPELARSMAYYNYQQYPTREISVQVFRQLNSHLPVFEASNLGQSSYPIQGFTMVQDNAILMADHFEKAILYNLKGEVLQQFKGHAHAITDIEFSLKSSLGLTSSYDKTAKLWQTDGTVAQSLIGHQDIVTAVAFSPNGKKVLTASTDKTAKLWDLEGKMLQTFYGHQASIDAVAFSPDSLSVLTGSEDHTAKLWDVNGNLIYTLKGHSQAVTSVSFSEDNQYLLTTSQDSTAILWNTKGEILSVLKGHQDAVNTATFSIDKSYIITGSDDGTLKIWDLHGVNIQTLNNYNSPVNQVVCSTDGQFIWSTDQNQILKSWWTFPAFFQAENNHFAIDELIAVGLQVNWEDIEVLENEEQLVDLFYLFSEQENWNLAMKTYEKLSSKEQHKADRVCRYFHAKGQLEKRDIEELDDFDQLSHWSIFAPYFAAQKDTSTALVFYHKILQADTILDIATLLDWYGLTKMDQSSFETLLKYEKQDDWSDFANYFYKQKHWKEANTFYQKMIANSVVFSAEEWLAWYETEQALGKDVFNVLLETTDITYQKSFAWYFKQAQDWEKALSFYKKVIQEDANAINLLEYYEIQQQLGKDSFEELTQADYASYWNHFAQYFEQKQEWEKAKTLYEQLIVQKYEPTDRHQLFKVNQKLEIYGFRKLFLPNNAAKLKQNYQYFNQQAQEKLIGYQKEDYEKAVRVSEHLLLMKDSRSNRQRLATFYNRLAWDRLHAGDFLGSLTYIKREKDVDAEIALHRRILPTTLLFLNDTDRAKKLYRRWRNKKLPLGSSHIRFKDAYLADLLEFENKGLIHPSVIPALAEIKALLKK